MSEDQPDEGQLTSEEVSAEAARSAKAQLEGKPAKTKQEIINQMGRISEGLVDRANELPDMKKHDIRLRNNGSAYGGVFTNAGQVIKSGTIGDTELRAETNSGLSKLNLERPGADGTTEKLEAATVRARPETYGAKSGSTTHSWSTAEKRVVSESDDQLVVHEDKGVRGTTRYKDRPLDPDNLYEDGNDYLKVHDQQSYKTDDQTKKDYVPTEELTDLAITQAAQTLGSMRGAVASAEKQAQSDQEETQQPVAS